VKLEGGLVDEDIRRVFGRAPRCHQKRRSWRRRLRHIVQHFQGLHSLHSIGRLEPRKRAAIGGIAFIAAIGSVVLAAMAYRSGTASISGKGNRGEQQASSITQHPSNSVLENEVAATGSPQLQDLGEGRYKGPNGTIVTVPSEWEILKGDQIELWATLVPNGSKSPIPRIGIGNVAAEGIDGADALETVGYYLSEILPELTSTEEPFRGGILVKGKGTVDGTQLEEVRWMYPLENAVLVVWGLFPPGYPGAEDLVVNSVKPPG